MWSAERLKASTASKGLTTRQGYLALTTRQGYLALTTRQGYLVLTTRQGQGFIQDFQFGGGDVVCGLTGWAERVLKALWFHFADK